MFENKKVINGFLKKASLKELFTSEEFRKIKEIERLVGEEEIQFL